MQHLVRHFYLFCLLGRSSENLDDVLIMTDSELLFSTSQVRSAYLRWRLPALELQEAADCTALRASSTLHRNYFWEGAGLLWSDWDCVPSLTALPTMQ